MAEVQKPPPPLLPPKLAWFLHTQKYALAGCGFPDWFHGAISREVAENLLESQPPGTFLLRVSRSHMGYTLSYKAQGCCRHLMIKILDDGTFVLAGDAAAHASLDALVAAHRRRPLRPGGELLLRPCRRVSAGPALPQPRKEAPFASWPPKAPLGKAPQRLWKSLKALPRTGQSVQQRLKAHLLGAGNLGDSGHASGPSSDPQAITSLPDPSVMRRVRDAVARKVARPASWCGAVSGLRTEPGKRTGPELGGPTEAQGYLPEEYLRPPPFAPGYC